MLIARVRLTEGCRRVAIFTKKMGFKDVMVNPHTADRGRAKA
jgi:hypothetical protein